MHAIPFYDEKFSHMIEFKCSAVFISSSVPGYSALGYIIIISDTNFAVRNISNYDIMSGSFIAYYCTYIIHIF